MQFFKMGKKSNRRPRKPKAQDDFQEALSMLYSTMNATEELRRIVDDDAKLGIGKTRRDLLLTLKDSFRLLLNCS